ncbi:unnamed protein product, partial [Linum tenue]
ANSIPPPSCKTQPQITSVSRSKKKCSAISRHLPRSKPAVTTRISDKQRQEPAPSLPRTPPPLPVVVPSVHRFGNPNSFESYSKRGDVDGKDGGGSNDDHQ